MNHENRMVTIYRGNGQPMKAKRYDRNALCECGSGKKQKKCCGTETKYFTKRKPEPEQPTPENDEKEAMD